jgi:hypothetical protein
MIIDPERLPLTQSVRKRKLEENRDQLTPFSAPSGPARSSETYSSTTKKFRVFTLDVSLPFIERSLTQAIMADQFPASEPTSGSQSEGDQKL